MLRVRQTGWESPLVPSGTGRSPHPCPVSSSRAEAKIHNWMTKASKRPEVRNLLRISRLETIFVGVKLVLPKPRLFNAGSRR